MLWIFSPLSVLFKRCYLNSQPNYFLKKATDCYIFDYFTNKVYLIKDKCFNLEVSPNIGWHLYAIVKYGNVAQKSIVKSSNSSFRFHRHNASRRTKMGYHYFITVEVYSGSFKSQPPGWHLQILVPWGVT